MVIFTIEKQSLHAIPAGVPTFERHPGRGRHLRPKPCIKAPAGGIRVGMRTHVRPPSHTLANRASTSRMRLVLATALLIGIAADAAAAAESGVQTTPDGKRTLVSKDVGDQRWAITRDLQDGTVTGNVFYPGGGAASFVWCERAADAPAGEGEIALSCYGADSCPAAPCTADAWSFIATVTLPSAFFEPPPAVDPDAVPTTRDELFAYLQGGGYRGFARESAVHASAGPHGGSVLTFINGALERSLAAGNAAHPKGAAAVKELYGADRTTLTGWAVEVKTEADSAGGQGWYWYEVFSTTDGSRPIEGFGNPVCTGCHAEGRDYVRIPFPLQ